MAEGLLLPQTNDNNITLPRFDHYNFSVKNFTTYSQITDLLRLMKPSRENDLKLRKAQGMNTVESHTFLAVNLWYTTLQIHRSNCGIG